MHGESTTLTFTSPRGSMPRCLAAPFFPYYWSIPMQSNKGCKQIANRFKGQGYTTSTMCGWKFEIIVTVNLDLNF